MASLIARTASTAAFAAALLTSAAAWSDAAEKLGTVSFENSCSAAVQPHLQRAVALLHSFWWSEGDKAFRDVLQRDPGCAIAGWGIAALWTETEVFVIRAGAIGVDSQTVIVMPSLADIRCELD